LEWVFYELLNLKSEFPPNLIKGDIIKQVFAMFLKDGRQKMENRKGQIGDRKEVSCPEIGLQKK